MKNIWKATQGMPAFVTICALLVSSLVPFWPVQGQPEPPPVRFHRAEQAIPNRYIVVLKDDSLGFSDLPAVPDDATPKQRATALRQRDEMVTARVRAKAGEMARAYHGRIEHVYDRVLKGFTVEMSEDDALALSQHPQISYVEEDAEISLGQFRDPNPPQVSCAITGQQGNAPWGLDRIDQAALPLNGTYWYGCDTGANVHVYVLDSGIRVTHQEFEGRASNDADFIGDGRNGNDCNGHGTHVAASIGGRTFGVAKNVRLHGIRVFDCNGRSRVSTTVAGMNSIIEGVHAVRMNHAAPAIANLSLGGAASFTLDFAVQALINEGVPVVVAAGNGSWTSAGWSNVGVDASSISPAHVRDAITVGATNTSDNRAGFSNFGSYVDLFAPGVNITSAWPDGVPLLPGCASVSTTNGNASASCSGTSMAAPHVAGVAALYLQRNPRATPTAVQLALTMNATRNQVINPGAGSPNRLLSTSVNVSGLYVLRAKHSGKALDVWGLSPYNGAAVQQWDYWGGENQKWLISNVGDGYYKLIAKHSGKALDVSGFSPYNGAGILQWDYWGGDNQKWELMPVEDGYYRLTAKHSGKSLDVSGISPYNGAGILQWDYWGGDNQKWSLERAR
jgi:hypothetical protein